jgi:hypothetical protein
MHRMLIPGIVLMSLLSVLWPKPATAQSSVLAFVARGEQAISENHPGRAVLDLERARLLSPSSGRIADDLLRVRLAANLPTTEPLAAGTPSQLRRADRWGQVALAGIGLAAGAILAVVGKLGRRAFLVVALVGGLVATVGFWTSLRAEPPANLAVVMSSDLVAREAPSADARVLFVPREGSLVSVLRTRGCFILISTAGRRGWVPAGGVETILRES